MVQADALMKMASSLAGSGDRVKALATVSKVDDVMKDITDRPNVVALHIRLAEVYKAMGDDDNASAEVTQAIAGTAKEEPQQKAFSLMGVSEVCGRLGYFDRASKIAETIQIPEYKLKHSLNWLRSS